MKTYEHFSDFKHDYDTIMGGSTQFPMVQSYIDYDGLYSNDDLSYWGVETLNGQTIAILCFRKPTSVLVPDSQHIAVFEVNKDLRGCGFGSAILKQVTNEGLWTLFAKDELTDFYKRAGFLPSDMYNHFFIKEPVQ